MPKSGPKATPIFSQLYCIDYIAKTVIIYFDFYEYEINLVNGVQIYRYRKQAVSVVNEVFGEKVEALNAGEGANMSFMTSVLCHQ